MQNFCYSLFIESIFTWYIIIVFPSSTLPSSYSSPLPSRSTPFLLKLSSWIWFILNIWLPMVWGYSPCQKKKEIGLTHFCAQLWRSWLCLYWHLLKCWHYWRVVITVKMWQQRAEFHPEFNRTCRKWTLIQVEDKNQ